MKCEYCGSEITEKRTRRGAKFCSSDCYIDSSKQKYRSGFTGNDRSFSSSSTGAAHELLVCANLLKLGFHVFRSQSPACPCDLVVMCEDGIYLVEVTTGYRGKNAKLFHPTKDRNKFDWLAIVLHDGKIIYQKNGEEFSPSLATTKAGAIPQKEAK
mgnify:CR=1 FL=1